MADGNPYITCTAGCGNPGNLELGGMCEMCFTRLGYTLNREVVSVESASPAPPNSPPGGGTVGDGSSGHPEIVFYRAVDSTPKIYQAIQVRYEEDWLVHNPFAKSLSKGQTGD
ncbi:unnamed protein product [Calicophoron daubneyi]|uniref:Uncharacterized protein n=1 Tax=Calicophoron daubneyi TaxID=300641 RepID=A0AAV2T1J0_CALDB